MCPHGYHHSGSMATPTLGTRDVSIDLFYDSSRFLHQIFDFISRLHQGDCVASTVTHRSIADTKI